ncbi:MerR family transcriptional regulator [Lachnospiraceae bacterium ZAX-1]
MYKISEFSKIVGLTVKTLRYYDERQLLEPTSRSENGYRMYNEEDYTKAQLIVLLKDLDFTLAEIEEIMGSLDGYSDLSFYLEEKKLQIEKEITRKSNVIKRINKLSVINQKGDRIVTDYVIERMKYPLVKTLSVRYHGNVEDMGKYISDLYGEAKGAVSGSVFACYYDTEYRENMEIELCLPVKTAVKSKRTRYKKFSAIEVITTTHIGEYSKLGEAYKSLMDYAQQNGIELCGPWREIYCKGPGKLFKGNPQKYVTQIIVPVEVN